LFPVESNLIKKGLAMFKKVMSEVKELTWTLGGTGLVLITLSGQTRTFGIQITLVSLALYIVSAVITNMEE
jgi:hypothetical protein